MRKQHLYIVYTCTFYVFYQNVYDLDNTRIYKLIGFVEIALICNYMIIIVIDVGKYTAPPVTTSMMSII